MKLSRKKVLIIPKPTTTFNDVQMLSKLNPVAYQPPEMVDILRLKEGDHVKVGASSEWFWVEILTHTCGTLTGRVDTDLVFTSRHGLRYNDVIEFEHRNIHSICNEKSLPKNIFKKR